MHVVGEFQIRHPKNRATIEKVFGWIYRLVDLVQLTALLVFAAQLTNSFPSTFLDVEFWSPSTYALSLLLEFKTQNCSAVVDGGSATGFSGLSMNVTSSNVATLWDLHTERIRVAFAMAAVGFIVSALNRMMMRHNVFFVSILSDKLRLHKDIVTVLDISLEIGALVLAASCIPTGEMLQAYLKVCGVRNEDSVAFISLAGIFVSASVCLGQHLASIIAVLVVGLTMDAKMEPLGPAATASSKEPTPKNNENEQNASNNNNNNNNNNATSGNVGSGGGSGGGQQEETAD